MRSNRIEREVPDVPVRRERKGKLSRVPRIHLHHRKISEEKRTCRRGMENGGLQIDIVHGRVQILVGCAVQLSQMMLLFLYRPAAPAERDPDFLIEMRQTVSPGDKRKCVEEWEQPMEEYGNTLLLFKKMRYRNSRECKIEKAFRRNLYSLLLLPVVPERQSEGILHSLSDGLFLRLVP